ncbi:MAG: tetratricopeptide repeat protein [Flavobacteriales bacterium]
MKQFLTVLTGVLLSSMALAQDSDCWGETEDQKTLCREAYGIWQGDREQDNLEVAYTSWLRVRGICPECVSEKLYTEGAKYYDEFADLNEKDSTTNSLYIDSLLMIYQARMDLFPKKKALIQGKYGTKLFKERPNQYDKAQTFLEPSIEARGWKSSASTIQAYYYTIYKQYAQAVNEKDSTLKVTKKLQLLEEFVKLNDLVEESKKNSKSDAQKNSYEKVRKNLLKIFLQVESDCDNLLDLLKTNLVKEGDTESIKKALTILTLKKCTDDPLYGQWAKESDDGSAKSAYSIGLIQLKSEEYSEALKWLELAVERCPDCEERLEYLMRAGQVANINKATSKAKGYARQMLEIDSKSGDAYLILGDAWSNSNCNDDKFGKACSYWVSYDYYAKAKSLDSELASKAQKSMSSVRKGWPESRELFVQGVTAGSSYTCCGVTTTVRTRD